VPAAAAIQAAQRIEHWPLDRLVPYDRNARTHSPEQVAQIAASIQEFGFTNPILVDGKDGIIAGHGRLQAARELAMATVPVVVLDHLTPAQKRAYVLADNKLALNAGWDDALLAEEITALHLQDFDLSVLGWSDKELAGILDPDGIDDLPPGADDPGKEYEQKYAVAVECADETEQERVYEDLTARGMTCRLLTV
jgi:ParB-like chromosome segregation protein Spo0J